MVLLAALAQPADVATLAATAAAPPRRAALRAIRVLGQRDDAAGAVALHATCAVADRCDAVIVALSEMPTRWAVVALDSLADDPRLSDQHRQAAGAAATAAAGRTAWAATSTTAAGAASMAELAAASEALADDLDRALRGDDDAFDPVPVYLDAPGQPWVSDLAHARAALSGIPARRTFVWSVALVGLRGGEVVTGLQVAVVPQAGGAASVVPGVSPEVADAVVAGLPERIPAGLDALLALGPGGHRALTDGSCAALPVASVDALGAVLGETGSVALLRRAEVEGRRLRCGDGADVDEIRVIPTALHVLFDGAPGRPAAVVLELTSPGGVLGLRRVSAR